MAKNFVSNKDETVRLFENDFLESLSKVHYSVPLYVFIPIIIFFLYQSIFIFRSDLTSIVSMILWGIIVWSFTEYMLHRFVFHHIPSSQLGERVHFIFHGVHHDYPSDSKRLVMPPSVSIPLALLFYFLFFAMFGEARVASFMPGFLAGYLFYDMTHYAIHHFNIRSKLWLALKKHHIKHHYQDPNKGYGVSSPIWDKIMSTDFPNKEK